jgi:hypothetical protein
MAAKFVEDGIATCATWTLMTKFLAAMFGVATLQLSTTAPGTNMFGFKILMRLTRSRVQWSTLAAVRLALSSFLLSSAAVLAALVTPTVQRNFAYAPALGRLVQSLVADGPG